MRTELYFSCTTIADDGQRTEQSLAEHITIDIDPERALYRASDGHSEQCGYGTEHIEAILDYIRVRYTHMVPRKPRVRYSNRVY